MILRLSAVASIAVLLSACGGGGGGEAAPPPVPNDPTIGFFDATAQEPSALTSLQFGSTTLNVTRTTGVLDRAADTITVVGLTGTISDDRQTVTLTDGGTVTIDRQSPEFVALFTAEPLLDEPTFGVVGVPSEVASLPSTGQINYTSMGTALVEIIDGAALYELSGDVAATVDPDLDRVTVTLSQLDGERSDLGLSGQRTQVTDVAIIEIDQAVLSGSSFSGGSASFDSTQITATLTGNQDIASEGGLFGPGGDEIGGVMVIDDTDGAGTLLIQGRYVAGPP